MDITIKFTNVDDKTMNEFWDEMIKASEKENIIAKRSDNIVLDYAELLEHGYGSTFFESMSYCTAAHIMVTGVDLNHIE